MSHLNISPALPKNIKTKEKARISPVSVLIPLFGGLRMPYSAERATVEVHAICIGHEGICHTYIQGRHSCCFVLWRNNRKLRSFQTAKDKTKRNVFSYVLLKNANSSKLSCFKFKKLFLHMK